MVEMVRRVAGMSALVVGGLATGFSLLHLPLKPGPEWLFVVGVAAVTVSILLASSERRGLWVAGAVIAFLGGILTGLMGPLCELVSLIVIAVICFLGGLLLVFWPERH